MSPHFRRCWVALIVAHLATCASGQATQPVAATEYHPSAYPETYHGVFYPGTELRALPGARAQAVVAKAELRRAETNLHSTIADAHRSFQHSAELKDAMTEERVAYESLQAAREAALEQLKNDPTYQAAIQLRSHLADQIEDAHLHKETTKEQMIAMANMKLSYSSKASTMESAAIAADPRAQAARQRLIAAGNRLTSMSEQFDDAVRTSEVVLGARKAVQDARVAALGADALYIEAVNVANAALDYAYHLYDRPQPYVINSQINSPYDGVGYGYPVTSGYQVGYPIGYPHSWWGSGRHN